MGVSMASHHKGEHEDVEEEEEQDDEINGSCNKIN